MQANAEGGLVLCAPIFVELLGHPKGTLKFVNEFLATTGIQIDFLLDEIVWLKAGESFAAYANRRRRAGEGQPKRLLVDFVVGAHAAVRADRLLTLDSSRYKQAFPDLKLWA